jgi:hypothetical protein
MLIHFSIKIFRWAFVLTFFIIAFYFSWFGCYYYIKSTYSTEPLQTGIKTIEDKQEVLVLFFGFIGVLCSVYTLIAYIYDNKLTDRQLAQFLLKQKYVCTLSNKSIRTEELDWIRDKFERPISGDKDFFAVVIGPRGAGKTTSVETAADGFCGVIFIKNVPPGATVNEIIGKVWNEINDDIDENAKRARNVIREYKSISGGRSPIVIISAAQRSVNKEPAELTAAGRDLVSNGLNVLIDASENAMPEVLSGREIILEIKLFDHLTMKKLTQFESLFKFLKTAGNEDLILALCGGCPLLLKRLNSAVKLKDNTRAVDEKAVHDFVNKEIREANVYIKLLSSKILMKSVSLFF